MPRRQSTRKLERAIDALGLDPMLANLPKPLRVALARQRFGWIDFLLDIQNAPTEMHSLQETEKANAIFVHIPKTGGVSVAKSLFGSHVASHTPLHMYLALYGGRQFDAMYKFCFVRNPWTRVASAYQFLKAGGLTEADRAWALTHLGEFTSLDDFVTRGLPRDEVRKWVHFRSQTDFLIDPRTGGVGVDFLGRFERLEKDFDTIAKRLGLVRELPHLNKTNDRAKPKLSQSSIEVIAELYD